MEQVNQYDIVLVNLDPTVGSEMKKTRPCVVLSPDEMNRHLQTIVVAPITTSSKKYPTRVEVRHKTIKGWLAIDQIRTIDRKRIIKSYGMLAGKETETLKQVIRQTFVD